MSVHVELGTVVRQPQHTWSHTPTPTALQKPSDITRPHNALERDVLALAQRFVLAVVGAAVVGGVVGAAVVVGLGVGVVVGAAVVVVAFMVVAGATVVNASPLSDTAKRCGRVAVHAVFHWLHQLLPL